jgi:HK97 family phage major capsid protein
MGEVVSRVRRVPISTNANSIKLPAVDETSRVDGSRWGGVRAYWANEADTVTASRPKFRTIDLTLEKLMAIGYATEELLQDASALESVMMQAFAEEMSFKAEDAIINGDGSGKPLGVLNSGAVVSVAAESGQAVSTVVTQNILNMWSRLPIRARRSAVWYINQDVEKQLYALTLGSGTAVVLLYTPPGVNGNNSPYGLLMGRPVIPVEYCATLGTAGDIILMDPQSYVMADKGGVAAAQSMHVRFLYDEMTFRFTYRLDGQPIWRTALTPFKGANTLSPYITLAARA